MATEKLRPPQLITDARMVYIDWIPADAKAAAALVPKGLTPAANGAVYINQYVVDRAEQTSSAGHPAGFGAYSLTYLGVDLAGLDASATTPGRWWTHYFNSSANMRDYAVDHGVPAAAGATTLDLQGEQLVATSFIDGKPVIRTRARVKVGTTRLANGQLRYITRVEGRFVTGRYPFVANLAEQFAVESLEFLDPGHSCYALRPKLPLAVTFGFYSPKISFCYPGGEGPL